MVCKVSNFFWLILATLFVFPQAHAEPWTTSVSVRERYQSFDNFNFNSALDNNSWEFDSRLYVKAKREFSNGLELYLQPQAIFIKNHSTVYGTQNFTQAGLLQAYLQYRVDNLSARLGRQQLIYGDQRLLGGLNWKDVARTFDGVKVMYHNHNKVKLDLFAVHPADISAMTPTTTSPHGKSLVTWEDRRLIGGYGTYTFSPKNGVDVYFINWHHNQHATVGKGRNINTFGSRLFGRWNGFDGAAEAVFQTGTWSNNVSQRASAFAVRAGYTFDFWDTRLGVAYDYSPGDNKADPTTHKNFVFPFNTNHMHYGEMDRFSWANMREIHLSLKTSPIEALTLSGNVYLLSLDKAQGDWLNVAGSGVLYAGSTSYTQTKAGTETDLKAIYKTHGIKFVALYGIFNPGSAVAERNGGKADTAKFGYVFANLDF